MATFTARLNATKPASSENVNITTIDDAFDLFDAAVGATVAASASKPASAFSGRLWYESDTGRFKVNAAASASAAASWVSPSSPTGGGAFYVSDYGNGISASAISLAASAAAAGGGGEVVLGPGRYSLSSTITPPAASGNDYNLIFRGAGIDATTLVRSANNVIFDVSGSAGSVKRRVQFKDMTLEGGGNTGWTQPLMRTWYNQQLLFQRVHFFNSYGSAVDGVQLWDTWFEDCEADYVGTNSASGAPFWFKVGQQGAASGSFGYSTDNSNNIWMINTRIEQCRGGGVYLDGRNEGGTYTGSRQVNRCYFINLKQENTVATFAYPFLKAENANHITWQHGHASAKSLDVSASAAKNFIEFTSVNVGAISRIDLNTLTGASANSGRAGVALLGGNSLIDLNHITGNTQSDNKFTVGLVEYTGTNTQIRSSMLGWQNNGGSATLISGAPTSGNEIEGNSQPAMNKFIAWNYDVAWLTGSTLSTATQQVYVVKIPVPKTMTIVNVFVQVQTAGSGLTLAHLAVFNSSGTRLGRSGDLSSTFNSGTGTKGGALVEDSSQTLTIFGGENTYVYAAALFVGTTPPILHRLGNVNPNAGLVAADGFRFANGPSGQATMPSSLTVSSFTSGNPIWFGLT